MRRYQSRWGSEDLPHMRIRGELLRLFRDFAEREALTAFGIAVVCRTSRPRGWRLLHGPIEEFNSETLIDILTRFGFTIEVRVAGWRRVKLWGANGVVTKDIKAERMEAGGGSCGA